MDELKDLMSISDEKAKFQKLEKAEILEMVVSHMRNMQTSLNNSGSQNGNENQENGSMSYCYSLAYRQCLNEFQSFLAAMPDLNDEIKSRVMTFMTQRYMDSMNSGQIGPIKKKTASPTNPANGSSVRHTPYNKNQLKSKRKSSQQDELSILTVNESNSTNISNLSYSSSSSSSSSSYFYANNQAAPPTPGSPSQFEDSTIITNSSNSSSASSSPSSSPIMTQNNTVAAAAAASTLLAKNIALAQIYSNLEIYKTAAASFAAAGCIWRPYK